MHVKRGNTVLPLLPGLHPQKRQQLLIILCDPVASQGEINAVAFLKLSMCGFEKRLDGRRSTEQPFTFLEDDVNSKYCKRNVLPF